MLLLLAAAVYVEVAPSPGPYLLDRVHTPMPSFDDTLDCMEGKCGQAVETCLASDTCAHRLDQAWHKVKVADMTEAETGLMACCLHKQCLLQTTEGWHGTVRHVTSGGQQFAWRQPVGYKADAAASADTAMHGALLASSLQCPGVVPVIDDHPEVQMRSGEVVKAGFVMPLMDGSLSQWAERQTKESGSACIDHVATQAGGAIACLHARGYTHGDVHSDNFLYKDVPGGCPRLGVVDFERLRRPTDQEGPATGSAGIHDWEKLAMMLHMLEHPEESQLYALETPPKYPLTQALLSGAIEDKLEGPSGPTSFAEQAMLDFLHQHA